MSIVSLLHPRYKYLFALLALLCLPAMGRATTVQPLTFDDVVRQADVIFVGDVIDVHPYTMQAAGRTIVKTRVTFRVADPIYGTKSLVEVFDFLGGRAGNLDISVAGMPTFAVGDRRVVFAYRAQSVNPIVGFSQGLLRVQRDSNAVDRVSTAMGTPLIRTDRARLLGPLAVLPNAEQMRLSDLRRDILDALAEAHKQ